MLFGLDEEMLSLLIDRYPFALSGQLKITGSNQFNMNRSAVTYIFPAPTLQLPVLGPEWEN